MRNTRKMTAPAKTLSMGQSSKKAGQNNQQQFMHDKNVWPMSKMQTISQQGLFSCTYVDHDYVHVDSVTC